jgi:hypothetical protein
MPRLHSARLLLLLRGEEREVKLHHASSIKDRTSMSSVVSSRGIAITLLESITDSQVVPRDH